MTTKNGLRPANCVSVCDKDYYTGEIIVALHNDTDEPRTVTYGDKITQLIFLPYVDVNFCEVDKLDDSKRGRMDWKYWKVGNVYEGRYSHLGKNKSNY